MGAAVDINLKEVDKLERRLNAYTLSGGDKERLMTSLGGVAVEQTQVRFDTETNPEGDRWRTLTEAYKKRKLGGDKKRQISGSGGGILEREGMMRLSIMSQMEGGDAILIGSPMEYAVFHQEAKSEKRKRVFLGFGSHDIAELQDAVDLFMEKHVA